MKLVSDQRAEDIARARVNDDLKFATRHLAANLLRIMAGGGQRIDLYQQVAAMAQALERVSLADCDGVLRNALDLDAAFMDSHPWLADRPENEESIAEDHIYKFAMRTVAATLEGQHTHVTKNNSEMHSAFRWWQKAIRSS